MFMVDFICTIFLHRYLFILGIISSYSPFNLYPPRLLQIPICPPAQISDAHTIAAHSAAYSVATTRLIKDTITIPDG